MKIAFIGGGNMASALIAGLQQQNAAFEPGPESGHGSGPESGNEPGSESRHGCRPEPAQDRAHEIAVADPNEAVRERLGRMAGVRCDADAKGVIAGADVVVLAVKPQIAAAALEPIGSQLTPNQTLVSVAAGTTIATLHGLVAADVPVVRTMPNTPALLGMGITGLFADERCSDRDRAAAERVMGACGETVWVEDEDLMDVVTAISGSGPAYYYLFTEALADAGEALGLPAETARRLAVQTALGAGAMAGRGGDDVVQLRRKVTSPGGTTEAAIESLEADALRDVVARAAQAAVRRGRELAGKEPNP